MINNNMSPVTPTQESGQQSQGSVVIPILSEKKEGNNVIDLKELYPDFRQKIIAKGPVSLVKVIGDISLVGNLSPRLKGVLLMSMLANQSAMMGHVRFMYGMMYFSLNVMYVHKSEAGTGKSIMTLASHVTDEVNKYLENETKEKRLKWEESQLAWELELSRAKKEKRLPDMSLKPDREPPVLRLTIPASISRSQLILHMKNMQYDGTILSSSEINSMVSAIKQDYGNYADTICKAAQNERDGQYYKVDGMPVEAESPMLSISISGTSDQYYALFRTLRDGMWRRFLHHQGEAVTQWVSRRPCNSDGPTAEDMVKAYSQYLLQMWIWQRQFDRVEVTFTSHQWDRHDAKWAKSLKEVSLETGNQFNSIPLSFGFHQLRLASILSMLRYWDEHHEEILSPDYNPETFSKQIVCTDDDFDVAEHLVTILYQHALSIAVTKEEKEIKGVKDYTEWKWTDDALYEMYKLYGEATFQRKNWFSLITKPPFSKSESTGYITLRELVRQKKLSHPNKNKKLFVLSKSMLRQFCKKTGNPQPTN